MKKRRFTLVVLVIVVSLGTVGLAASSALASGDVNERICPNEANTGFSAELPDCRAYEQVSPTFKNGFGATLLYVMNGGNLVQLESLGAFSGAVAADGCAINEYAIARTATGWTTSALNDAPLTQLDSASKECAPHLLSDDGASLLVLRPAAGSVYARDLYLHEPDGTFVPVGPTLPANAVPLAPTGPGEAGSFQPGGDFLDATPDLTHVLFTLEAQSQNLAPGVETELWPTDTTHPSSEADYVPSLYEYIGTNNTTPTLVGVDNSGHLISDCGTSPGGWDEHGNGNHLNAISENGSRIFFTAVGTGEPEDPACEGAEVVPPVNELFARDGGAGTIAISEPDSMSLAAPDDGCSSSECRNNIESPANFRDANFEGASRNGSKVFFTSTQQLLNDAAQDSNPGDSAAPRALHHKGCDATPEVSTGTTGPNGCNLYEYDFDNDPMTKAPVGLVLLSGGDSSGLGPEVQGVAAVSEDGSHVYFVARGVLTKEPNVYGVKALAGDDNLYNVDTTDGRTAFVCTLGDTDEQQWTFDAGGLGGHPMDVTSDGGYLVFTSANHVTPGDTSTVRQVFRYAAATGELVRISLGNEGERGLGASSVSARRSATTSAPEALDGDSHPAVSEDGSTVTFSTSEALVPQAPTDNRCAKEEEGQCKSYIDNIYEYRGGHIYLVAGDATEEQPVISSSGRDIAFVTHERLASSDVDTVDDIYDARIDGGFPSAAAVPCSGEGCQGASGGQSEVLTAPGSATFFGPGDVAPPKPAIAPKPKPKAKALTRAQKLAKALHTCRRKGKQARTSCEAAARRKYAPAKEASRNERAGR